MAQLDSTRFGWPSAQVVATPTTPKPELTRKRMSTTNVLPLFWHLSSTDRNTRLDATESLISSLEAFQAKHQAPKNGAGADEMDVDQPNGHVLNGDDEAEDEDDDEDDDESGVEVDASDDEHDKRPIGPEEKELKRLDSLFEKENSEDVRYSIKRLVRGLTSSRESSRLGFAVALTEVRLSNPVYLWHKLTMGRS